MRDIGNPFGAQTYIGGWLLATLIATSAWAGAGSAVQERIDADSATGRPVVVHLTVALCDNANQGIVPVPEALGNGQDPKSNLYWGALYGVRNHLPRAAGWTKVDAKKPENPFVLDRVVLYTKVKRGTASVPVYVVADAWDGAHIRESLQAYLEMAAGRLGEEVDMAQGAEKVTLQAGGSAHLVAFVGHNGLMDFSLELPKPPAPDTPPRSALILACASKQYFAGHLEAAGAHPLLLTTGLMAPEAYSLDGALRAWIGKGNTEATVEGAAQAYQKYQKCGIKGARRLFWGAP